MCESVDGWITPSTRQNAGSLAKDGAPNGDAGAPAGMTNAPAATVLAEVMVVSASLSAARLSQVAAASGAARSKIESRKRRMIMREEYHEEEMATD